MNSARTLKAAIETCSKFYEFSAMLPNFLDTFYAAPNPDLIKDEPPLLAGRTEQGAILDAYAAATAEALSRRFGFKAPAWICGDARICARPFFTMHTPAGRAFVLAYTPPAFKARQLFVGSEPLSRT